MLNGKWQMVKQQGFAICHLRFAIQDAFFRASCQALGERTGPRCARLRRVGGKCGC
jgi:hypothetical protein